MDAEKIGATYDEATRTFNQSSCTTAFDTGSDPTFYIPLEGLTFLGYRFFYPYHQLVFKATSFSGDLVEWIFAIQQHMSGGNSDVYINVLEKHTKGTSLIGASGYNESDCVYSGALLESTDFSGGYYQPAIIFTYI